MSKKTIITIIVAVLIIVAAILLAKQKDSTETSMNNEQEQANLNNNINSNTNGTQATGDVATLIRANVTDLGKKMKLVSVMGADFNSQVQLQYGSYVTPSLLTEWKANPSQALGRTTSNPYPDRIEISSITKQNETSYKVEGNVIEVATESPATVSSYPVTIIVSLDHDTWLITKVTKGVSVKAN